MYPDGIPDPDKLGFIPLNALGHGGEFAGDIGAVCKLLGREPLFVDARGYDREVTAASVNPTGRCYAWVECKSRDDGNYVDVRFDLRIVLDGEEIFSWEIYTYNPYFGCQIERFYWTADRLVMIYHEKHDTYVASIALLPRVVEQTPDPALLRRDTAEWLLEAFARFEKSDEPLVLQKITDEWLVWNDTLVYRSETVDQVERRSLPDLELLEPWTADHARQIGALPGGYDEMNEINRKFPKRPVNRQNQGPNASL